jgi:hypothetical protein
MGSDHKPPGSASASVLPEAASTTAPLLELLAKLNNCKFEQTNGDVWYADYDRQGEPCQVHVASGEENFITAAVSAVNALPGLLECVEALRPFAALAEIVLPAHADRTDDRGFYKASGEGGEAVITLGDLRKALAALSANPGGKRWRSSEPFSSSAPYVASAMRASSGPS